MCIRDRLPAAAADREVPFFVDALSVAGRRGIGKDGGTSAGHGGALYRAWISFLQRGALEKLGIVLSGRKAAGALDGYACYCK